jgi:hypothetical protein
MIEELSVGVELATTGCPFADDDLLNQKLQNFFFAVNDKLG